MIKKILHSTSAKIIIGFIVIFVACWIPKVWLNDILRTYKEIQIVRLTIIPIITIILILVSYIALFRYYEKRTITELSTKDIGKYLVLGLSLALLLPSLSILIVYLRGEYVILSVNDLTSIFLQKLTVSILFGIAVAIFEEVLFRGILFRLMEEKSGSYIAIIISCMIFGFVHHVNGNGSLLAVLTISIVGILMTAAYMYTRNLWFPVAIHFAWNFAEGDVFGTAVSGNSAKNSIIVSQLEGSKLFTGGAWGIEAAAQTFIFGLVAGIILLVLCHKKGEIIKPYWKK